MNEEYQLLDKRIQKWIFQQGWPDLREIQKKAIEPILSRKTDVIISANTAAGKTEAFFLPAYSSIVEEKESFGILYISPLKALINDQYRRLQSLCENLDLGVTPWHGDISQSIKKKARTNPNGTLLITPESLESLLIRDSGWVIKAFSGISYILIDEFHAFIGSERGHHLLSLLNRLEHLLDRISNPIPRVALSATLGEEEKVPLSLRPNNSIPCILIKSSKSLSVVRVQVRGYKNPSNIKPEDDKNSAFDLICHDLYKFCRGGSHLIFANSRQRTEMISAQLRDLCNQNFVPNEFFPHHGSLSKELRHELESRLQKETLPTTAVCTMTLELGIDIGKVNSVIQVTAPHSVSSLRQRLGRSGRRNEPATLRMLIAEEEINTNSTIIDKLRVELIQSLAMIRLLIENKWFEPADTSLYHFSTLIHQILAITAQWGGIRADSLYSLLCKLGPFQNVTTADFKILLSFLGQQELLTQISGGEITLGILGEKIVNHYSFYAVFNTPEEFRIIHGDKTLGTIPVDSLIIPGLHIVFSGRRWKVKSVDSDKKIIIVDPTKGGNPPKFGGGGMSIHDLVREEMFKIYTSNDYRILVEGQKIDYINNNAKELFEEAIDYFKICKLQNNSFYSNGTFTYIFTWKGDKINNTLSTLLLMSGLENSVYAGVIEVENATIEEIKKCLEGLLKAGIPSESELAKIVPEKIIEKYDCYLPDELLNKSYGKYAFNSMKTEFYLKELLKK